MPAVLALHERFQARGLRVSGVSEFDSSDAESERKSVTEAVHEEKMVYPTFLDDKGVWSQKQGTSAIPAFLVVNREGKIVFRHRGKLVVDSPVYAELTKAIESAL